MINIDEIRAYARANIAGYGQDKYGTDLQANTWLLDLAGEIEELRAALRPFAALARQHSALPDSDTVTHDVLMADLRRAAALVPSEPAITSE